MKGRNTESEVVVGLVVILEGTVRKDWTEK